MLSTKGLEKKYSKSDFLAYPEFSISAGEIVWLRGDSGTGKTTLLHLIAGILKADRGSILFKGEEVSSFSQSKRDRWRKQHINMIFQEPYLHPALTVEENLGLTAALKNGKIASENHLGVSSFQHKKPDQISGGQAQRAAVLRGLIGDGALLLADEPTSSLDPRNFEAVMMALKLAAEKDGKAILLSSHDPRTEAFAHRTIELLPTI